MSSHISTVPRISSSITWWQSPLRRQPRILPLCQ